MTSLSPENARFVGFWIRALCLLLDTLLFSAITILIIAVPFQFEFAWTHRMSVEQVFDTVIIGTLIAFQLVPWLLLVVCWIVFASTPSKMIFGIKILDASTFKRASFG